MSDLMSYGNLRGSMMYQRVLKIFLKVLFKDANCIFFYLLVDIVFYTRYNSIEN